MMPLSAIQDLRALHRDVASKAAFDYCAALVTGNDSTCEESLRVFSVNYYKSEVLVEVLK